MSYNKNPQKVSYNLAIWLPGAVEALSCHCKKQTSFYVPS